MNNTPVPKIDIRLLLTLPPFRFMADAALLDITCHADVLTLKAGKKLGEPELADSVLYLLSGKVDLVTVSNPVQTILTGSERAKTPLFLIFMPGTQVICKQPCRLLRIDQNVFKKYYTGVQVESAGVSLVEVTEDDPTQGNLLFAEIRELFHTRQIGLPSLPDVVRQINKALQDPRLDFQRVADIIQMDPVVAARLIQVANSALYMAVRPAESLKDAITRIGLEAVRAIVMTVALRNLFKPKASVIAQRMQQLYESSITVGVISHALTRRLDQRFDADHAFLAGLLHDIGVVPVLVVADGHSELKGDAPLLETAIRALRGPVGMMLLKEWQFDADLVTTAGEARRWERRVSRPDYCDIVQVAQLHAGLLGARKVEGPALNELPAFKRLELDRMDAGEGMKILQEAKSQINATIKLLLR